MDSGKDRIPDTEQLIRRIPPSSVGMETIKHCPEKGCFRPTSLSMSTRSHEEHLSCSLLAKTKPVDLLDQLKKHEPPIDPTGWHVCVFNVRDVRSIGLEVVASPTDLDPGHCSISASNGLAFPKNVNKKLAKLARVLTPDEVVAFSRT